MLRGDIVKDDSGAYAVFAEQGSSASQIIAAKVMDEDNQIVQDRPPTQYQLTPKKKWRTLQGCSEFQSQSVQISGYVFHDTSGPNLGQTSKTQWFLLNETCIDTHLLASCWKDRLRRFFWDLDEKKYRLGLSVWSSESGIVLVGIRG